MSEWRMPRRVKRFRRFHRRPDGCRIVNIWNCRRLIDYDRAECIGFAVSETDDEPCDCCKECRYLALNKEEARC